MTAAVLRVQVSPGDKHDDRERELFHHDFADPAEATRFIERVSAEKPIAEEREHVDAQRVVPSPVEVWLTDEYLRRRGVGSI